jgi:Ca2+-binding RTX toxin-like protein
VTINGDTVVEGDEAFFVLLSAATNGATISDGDAIGLIANDDTSQGLPEVSVLGNGLSIESGDGTPQLADGTDFGEVVQGSTVARTFTVRNDGQAVLTLGLLTVSGPLSLDNSDPLVGSLAPGQSDTFKVSLDTSTLGTRIGTISFVHNDSDENPFNFMIAGTVGTGSRDDDFADSLEDATAPFGNLALGGSTTGNLETAGDIDWFRITLTAGHRYRFDMEGTATGAGTVSDPLMEFRDSNGSILASDDDSGAGFNAQISNFVATYTGIYYLSGHSFLSTSETGTYRIAASETTNRAPTIISNGGGNTAFVSIPENSRFVTTVTATDQDGTVPVYSLSGGADRNRFTINPATGALSFVTGPDFETPRDSNFDNNYIVQVRATDGVLSDTQTLTIRVTNLPEPGIRLIGTNGNNTLTGTARDDSLFGRAGNDRLLGLGGNDRLFGEAGNDRIEGGVGNDLLTGGLGRDILIGGSGADMFDFNAASESRRGTLRDTVYFNHADGDKIDLRTIDADTDGTSGNQAFRFIGAAAFSGVDGQLRFKSGILQGDTNGDKVADFELRVVGTLLAGDIIL